MAAHKTPFSPHQTATTTPSTHHGREVHELPENAVALLLVHQLLGERVPHRHVGGAVGLAASVGRLHRVLAGVSLSGWVFRKGVSTRPEQTNI